MSIAIMQPYFIPYLGYFQLLARVDTFVVYDDVKYTKSGWINRNNVLFNQQVMKVTLPLQKDSDFCLIKQRKLATNWPQVRGKTLKRLSQQYRSSPFFNQVYPTIEKIFLNPQERLDLFIFDSLKALCGLLSLSTKLVFSSHICDTQLLKSQEKIFELCHALRATEYVNPIGGKDLYDKNTFSQHGISLRFIELRASALPASIEPEHRFLSIVHILFVLGVDKTREVIHTDWIES